MLNWSSSIDLESLNGLHPSMTAARSYTTFPAAIAKIHREHTGSEDGQGGRCIVPWLSLAISPMFCRSRQGVCVDVVARVVAHSISRLTTLRWSRTAALRVQTRIAIAVGLAQAR